MHQSVKGYVESHLANPDDPAIPESVRLHISACAECRRDLQDLSAQNGLIRSLRAPAAVEPAPAFYARVLNRIEQQREPESFWSELLEPAFFRRLAYSSAVFALLAGTYVFSVEDHGDLSPNGPMGLANVSADHSAGAPQRNAVLVNLVSYRD